MTCKDCKFYKNECESHSQLKSIGMKHDMKICEIFCPTFVDCWDCVHFKVCQSFGILTGRLTSCPTYQKKVANGRWISEVVRKPDWKGKMRDYYQASSCSICHNSDPGHGTSNYCPNCGARMDGDSQ